MSEQVLGIFSLRVRLEPKTALMSQCNGFVCFLPFIAAALENMYVVIAAPGNIELFTVRTPNQSYETVGHLQDLLQSVRLLIDIVDKNIFIGLLSDGFPVTTIIPIKSAGQDKKRISIRAHRSRNRMVHRKLRPIWQPGIQRLEDRSFRRCWRDHHSGRQDFRLWLWVVLRPITRKTSARPGPRLPCQDQ